MISFPASHTPPSAFALGSPPPRNVASSAETLTGEAMSTAPPRAAPASSLPSSQSSAASAVAAAAVTSPIAAFSRRCFLDSLSTLVGRKFLLLDEKLAGPLSLLVDAPTLQQHGVDRCYPLRAFPVPANSLSAGAAAAPFVLFVCRPRLALLPLLVQHIHFIEKTYQPTQPPSLSSSSVSPFSSFPPPSCFSPSGRHYVVLFIPSSSDFLASELRRLLSNPPPLPASVTSASASSSLMSNLSSLPAALTNSLLFNAPGGSTPATSSTLQLNLESTTVAGCPIYFFPLAPDVLSLELQNSFRDIHVFGDPSPCLHAAAAVQLLQQELQQNSVIPHLRCLGSAAKTVADHLIQQRKEKQAAAQQQALWGEAAASGSALWATSGGRTGGVFGADSRGVFHGEDGSEELLEHLAPVAPPVRFALSPEDLGSPLETPDDGPGSQPHRAGDEASKAAASPASAGADGENRRSGSSTSSKAGSASEGKAGDAETSSLGQGAGADFAESGRDPAQPTGNRGSSETAALRQAGRSATAGARPAVHVDMLVLVDRRSDLVTPLCSAFTYEALLDVVFGIDSAAVEVPQQLLQQKQASGEAGAAAPGSKAHPVLLPGGRRQKVPLSSDGLFATLRDLHQSAVGAHLHRVANEIQQTYKEKDELRSIQEISVFMNKFKVKQQEHSSLSLHVRLASFLASVAKDPAFFRRLTLEDELLQSAGSATSSSSGATLSAALLTELDNMIDATAPSGGLWWTTPGATPRGSGPGALGLGDSSAVGVSVHPAKPAAAPCVEDVYRLLCLASVVNGGLKGKQLEGLRKGLIHQHGLREAVRMSHLQKAGLLRQADGVGGAGGSAAGSWKALKKDCKLLVDEEQSVDDIAYACSGYAPLSVRLLQFLHDQPNGWRSIPHILSQLWGPAMEVRQQQPSPIDSLQALQQPLQRRQQRDASPDGDGSVETVMVMYLGGVTYAEIAAIRRLNEMEIVKQQQFQEQERRAHQGAPAAKPPPRRRYIIVTTEIINYRKLIASCGEDAEDPCERFLWQARECEA
ncbi:putative sec1 family domain-containing protein [Neospora caninum Liverpool]|uniref:Putative sec1 family domain-containing protein n=1 Tax=Neospora caninum (strain Liverpool) TaxID=572307 RepID=F0V7K5_NEOCL|nr:putative sec1 family domain-containing protein [Neospora caninum Liverpool]CBZ49696.1 putative sec1 family domain-containing protein [Neospora caninum Liverpool]CEL64281.1 TPA: sec1 family domain-containing protein, putative [Neospora caninum Liverpool]|eukprot:XP_003879731.1 putative sec1 family domain-containing protein [Neospora caninum Liverpool]